MGKSAMEGRLKEINSMPPETLFEKAVDADVKRRTINVEVRELKASNRRMQDSIKEAAAYGYEPTLTVQRMEENTKKVKAYQKQLSTFKGLPDPKVAGFLKFNSQAKIISTIEVDKEGNAVVPGIPHFGSKAEDIINAARGFGLFLHKLSTQGMVFKPNKRIQGIGRGPSRKPAERDVANFYQYADGIYHFRDSDTHVFSPTGAEVRKPPKR